MSLRRENELPVGDLILVPQPSRPVVLKSGGPVMEQEKTNPDGTVVCRWQRWDDGDMVTVNEWASFTPACLYRCVPMTEEGEACR